MHSYYRKNRTAARKSDYYKDVCKKTQFKINQIINRVRRDKHEKNKTRFSYFSNMFNE